MEKTSVEFFYTMLLIKFKLYYYAIYFRYVYVSIVDQVRWYNVEERREMSELQL